MAPSKPSSITNSHLWSGDTGRDNGWPLGGSFVFLLVAPGVSESRHLSLTDCFTLEQEISFTNEHVEKSCSKKLKEVDSILSVSERILTSLLCASSRDPQDFGSGGDEASAAQSCSKMNLFSSK